MDSGSWVLDIGFGHSSTGNCGLPDLEIAVDNGCNRVGAVPGQTVFGAGGWGKWFLGQVVFKANTRVAV